jgi:hypothetical protein
MADGNDEHARPRDDRDGGHYVYPTGDGAIFLGSVNPPSLQHFLDAASIKDARTRDEAIGFLYGRMKKVDSEMAILNSEVIHWKNVVFVHETTIRNLKREIVKLEEYCTRLQNHIGLQDMEKEKGVIVIDETSEWFEQQKRRQQQFDNQEELVFGWINPQKKPNVQIDDDDDDDNSKGRPPPPPLEDLPTQTDLTNFILENE